jgi:putative ribosome biogenesis GTPase RsgA
VPRGEAVKVLVACEFSGTVRDAFAAHAAADLEPARVVRTIRGHVWVAAESGVVRALPAGAIESEGEPGSFPVVGDWVGVRPGDGTASPVVEAMLPRRSRYFTSTA